MHIQEQLSTRAEISSLYNESSRYKRNRIKYINRKVREVLTSIVKIEVCIRILISKVRVILIVIA